MRQRDLLSTARSGSRWLVDVRMIHRRAAAAAAGRQAGRQHEHETQRDLDAVTDAEGAPVIFALKLCSFRHRPARANPNPVPESPSLRTRLELEQIHGLPRCQPFALPTWPLKMSEPHPIHSHNGRPSCFRTRDCFARNGE